MQISRTVRVTVRNSGWKVNQLTKVIGNRKIKTEFTSSISFSRVASPFDGH